jgi:hypothetical protein
MAKLFGELLQRYDEWRSLMPTWTGAVHRSSQGNRHARSMIPLGIDEGALKMSHCTTLAGISIKQIRAYPVSKALVIGPPPLIR